MTTDQTNAQRVVDTDEVAGHGVTENHDETMVRDDVVGRR